MIGFAKLCYSASSSLYPFDLFLLPQMWQGYRIALSLLYCRSVGVGFRDCIRIVPGFRIALWFWKALHSVSSSYIPLLCFFSPSCGRIVWRFRIALWLCIAVQSFSSSLYPSTNCSAWIVWLCIDCRMDTGLPRYCDTILVPYILQPFVLIGLQECAMISWMQWDCVEGRTLDRIVCLWYLDRKTVYSKD